MALPAFDNYLTRPSTAIGGNYTQQVSGQSVNSAGNLVDPASGQCASFWSADVFADDHYAEGTLGDLTNFVHGFVMVRCSGTGSVNGMVLFLNGFNGTAKLYSFVSGTSTELVTFDGFASFVENDVWRLSVSGQIYTCSQNGVDLGAPYTDSGTFTSGSAGIGGNSESWASFGADNIVTGKRFFLIPS